MKILVINQNNPFAHSNASSNRFLSLAEGLREEGCELDLIFLSGYYTNSEREKYGERGVCSQMNYEYLLPVDYTNLFKRQFFHRILPTDYLYIKVKKRIQRSHYDYIWIDYGPKAIQIGLKLFKNNIHGRYFHERSEFSWIGFSQFKALHKKYLHEFLPKIDVLSVMTQALEKYYKEFISEDAKIVHLPMTVDFSRFENLPTSSKYGSKYIGYCGTMNNDKDGVDILIKSFIKIKNKYPQYRLLLAGPFIPKPDYESQVALIDKENAGNQIIHIGKLTKNEVPSFLANADVLALARPASKQAEGGFPTKLGEYLATGRPVCVTDVGEIDQYLVNGKSAFISDPDSVKSFSETLEKALDSSKSIKVGELGKKVALHSFNKKVQSKLLFEFLAKH